MRNPDLRVDLASLRVFGTNDFESSAPVLWLYDEKTLVELATGVELEQAILGVERLVTTARRFVEELRREAGE